MPRATPIVNKLIEAKQAELEQDKEDLAKLKERLRAGPDILIEKQINALRTTVANGTEDLADLSQEMAEAMAYEASEAGQLKRSDVQRKVVAVDALAMVCVQTATMADRALYQAWAALRRHHAAHAALHETMADAYAGLTEGSRFDVHGDQVFLLQSYSRLSNGAPAIAQWLLDALSGYELENFIKVQGMTLHHNVQETLEGADSLMLGRMCTRLKEIAARCGVELQSPTGEELQALSSKLFEVIAKAPLQ